MKKKIISLTLALVMCLGLAMPAFAEGVTIGKMISLKNYNEVSNFSEGLAMVMLNNKLGYIDKTGKEVIPCKYDNGYDTFSEGLAAVAVGEYPNAKWGFIDKSGKEVIPFKYDNATNFFGGLAAVAVYTGEKNIYGDPIFKWGFIDKTGKEVTPFKYDRFDGLTGFQQEGLLEVQVENPEEKSALGQPMSKSGFIDKTGREVVPCKYDVARDFSDGLVAVSIGNNPNTKWGYIDGTGKEVILCQYDWALSFSEGFALVELGDRGFCIDKTGRVVFPFKYSVDVRFGYFSEGLMRVTSNYFSDPWGFIDTTGREIIPCKYDYAGDFSEGLAAVRLNGKYGYIDKTGKEVIPFKYDDAEDFSEGLAMVELNGKYGFIDKTGREVVPCKYNFLPGDFSEGLATVSVGEYPNEKYGYIDRTGKEVVPCKYDWAEDVSEGLALVRLNGKWGILPVNGTGTQPMPIPAGKIAAPSVQTVLVDGKKVEFAMYALNGGSTNYIRVRDLAAILNGTAAQFNVGWNGNVTLTSKTPYDGTSDKAPFNTNMAYTDYTAPTYVNGNAVNLEAIQISYNGGGYTYYKLRDLGNALGFNVGWSADKGVYVETDKPYNVND